MKYFQQQVLILLISQSFDHYDESPELIALEKQCACIVTMAWDEEISISDKETETI